MAVNKEDLDAFHQFALGKIERGTAAESVGELAELWDIEHPTPEQHSENVSFQLANPTAAPTNDLFSCDRCHESSMRKAQRNTLEPR